MKPNWLFYSYDAMGLGHVRRALALSRAALAARPDLSALLVTCSPFTSLLPMPRGLDYIKLPSATKQGKHRYVSRSLNMDEDQLHALRGSLLREAVGGFRPHLMLVDKAPDGMAGELLPALQQIRSAGLDTHCVLGWRDILDDSGSIQEEWRNRNTLRLIEEYYREIWVWGDAEWYDPRREYAMPDSIARLVRFMGYVCPEVSEEDVATARAQYPAGDGPRVLVTTGGGEDGGQAIAATLDAIAAHEFPPGSRVKVVFGPCMPAAIERRLRERLPVGVEAKPFVPGLAPLIAAADVVVGMAGYNTVSEALGAGTPLVLIPRKTPRREQWIRARMLAERGLAECVDPDTLSPANLGSAVRRAIAGGRPRASQMPRRDGLATVVREIDRILPAPSTAIEVGARERAR